MPAAGYVITTARGGIVDDQVIATYHTPGVTHDSVFARAQMR